MNKLYNQISSLKTEQVNKNSINIDQSSTSEILKIINDEDKKVAFAVEKELVNISKAVEIIVAAFRNGGRLIYMGAGTSGRLGIIDAAECPPTFGTNSEMVQGLIAGGKRAMFDAVEGAEDLEENGQKALESINANSKDIICGLAASGRTPFVIGGLKEAKRIGAKSVLITTVDKSQAIENGANADIMICPNVGPEVIMGSTRMKSGTAQKLVLNMLTTAAMVKLGKTYENVMIDLQMNNTKLEERAKKILINICNIDYKTAEKLLIECNGHVKSAIIMELTNCSYEKAQTLIKENDGFVRNSINKSIK